MSGRLAESVGSESNHINELDIISKCIEVYARQSNQILDHVADQHSVTFIDSCNYINILT